MLACAIAGAVIGWSVSHRSAWSLLLVVATGMASFAIALVHRFDLDVVGAAGAFWIAVESGWFVSRLVAGRSAEAGEDEAATASPTPPLTGPDWESAGGSRRSSRRSPT